MAVFATAATAQPPETEVEAISTERPTQGVSPDLIPKGSLQIENGFGASLHKGQNVYDLPESLFRLGIMKRLELRFLTSDAVYQPSHESGVQSLQSTDTQFSAKFLVAGPNSWMPKSAILSMDFPTGGQSYTSGSYDPGATLIWTQSPGHGIFINELAQVTISTLQGARRTVWTPSIAAGAPVNKKIVAFVEYAPNILQNNTLTQVVDAGLIVTKGKLRQFDFRGGFLRDDRGFHALISIGYSLRMDSLFGASGKDSSQKP
jgi:hypothetical protein